MGNGSGMGRRSLGRQLRALREKSGKTIEDVRPVASRNKIWRLETGKGPFKVADVHTLCWMYGADQETIDRLVDLALKTAGESIWEDYQDVMPSWFGTYVELEAAASTICTYETDLVPGLLQTPEYARAVFEATRPAVPEATIERLVNSRGQRQQNVLSETSGTLLNAVLNEAVLARQVGGNSVMAAQLAQIRTLNCTPNVRIGVLTWNSGAHAAMEGSFSLLEFARADEPAVAYQENRAGARYLERPEQVQTYREMFEAISRQAIPIEEYTS